METQPQIDYGDMTPLPDQPMPGHEHDHDQEQSEEEVDGDDGVATSVERIGEGTGDHPPADL